MEDLFKMVPAGCLRTISKKSAKIKYHKVLRGVIYCLSYNLQEFLGLSSLMKMVTDH